ncbi:hypothetical protein NDU88_003762 [Pleurodeles waltl]|uniref:Uncharacterized protein n=1 Tax=Pleurodeles waltl TaxID=8319 RepID=A0AAV7NHE6_PLEWA|nr:hypothetical protein NDU88_003762 [Pleurodeles waltl]
MGLRLFPAWLAKVVSGKFPDSVDKDRVLGEVKKKQDKVKTRYDQKTSTKELSFQPGDVVRVKLQTFVRKEEACYGSLVTVKKVCGNAIMVEGGQWWNLDKVVKVNDVSHRGIKRGSKSGSEGMDQKRKASDTNLLELHTLRRSVREKQVRHAVSRAEPLRAAGGHVFRPSRVRRGRLSAVQRRLEDATAAVCVSEGIINKRGYHNRNDSYSDYNIHFWRRGWLQAAATLPTWLGRRSTLRLFPAWLAKVVSDKFPDSVDKDRVLGEVKKKQDKVKLGSACSVACRTVACCLRSRLQALGRSPRMVERGAKEAGRRDSGSLRF